VIHARVHQLRCPQLDMQRDLVIDIAPAVLGATAAQPEQAADP
jgi:hypothetical protein